MNESKPDLVIIGGGPAGYVAALRAAQLGMQAVVVEREHPGGICSNWGCIPTKALLHAADLWREMQQAQELGIHSTGLSFDFERVVGRSREVAQRMNNGVRYLLKKNKVTLIEGRARLAAAGEVEVTSAAGAAQTLSAPHIIIATGARPRSLPHLPVDGDRVWSYQHALAPPIFPQTLAVLGAGAIGMEFASFYAAFGSQVTVLEMQPRVLPQEDEEVSAFVSAAFAQQGIAIRTGVTVAGAERHGAELVLTLDVQGRMETMPASHLLVSAGVVGNIEDIGLEAVGAKTEAGRIAVDAAGRTGVPGLYAIGDVTGGPWLAHKASHEAVQCVEAIAGQGHGTALDRRRIPACTYCHPQVASVGLTEAQARTQGYAVRVGRFPFAGNGRAVAVGQTQGFVKTIFDAQTGQLLGGHMVGAGVTELVHGLALASTLETTEAELLETVFPHPTMSEALHESVLMAYGRGLHA